MSKLKPFQLAIIFGCIFVGVAGLLIFAFLGPRPNKSASIGPTVVVWGTLPDSTMQSSIKTITDSNLKKKIADRLPLNVKYIEKDESTFRKDLLEAIAANQSPDLVILPIDSVLEEKSSISSIPFTSYPERTYQDTFIDEGNLFRAYDGYFAVPFTIDPLVLFYNKTLLTQSNTINPPQYWDEVISLIPKLTTKDDSSKILKSAIGLGEYRNITDSKDIISALLLQSGSTITSFNSSASNGTPLRSTLYGSESTSNILPPTVAAINFYTQFADPTKINTYTWNRALPNSQDYFSAGNLAMYIGFGSEIQIFGNKNPNLNFDINFIPQERTNPIKSTYGKLYGVSIIKNTVNSAGAFQALVSLTSNQFLTEYAKNSGLPPVRRDLLASVPTDSFSPILYESALKAKGWLDPDSVGSNSVFMSMIESVLSGQMLPNQSAQRAQQALEVLTNRIK